ncbi:MAG: hypothetical protein ACK4FF_10480 [Limnobacter sp.]|uniref:hypothetical protein n=1 Tax=Limnobacter sp. TaxID=2003368 RepID=UPI00391D77CA
MKIHKLVPSFDSRSTQARIYKAHASLGSQMHDVAMPETTFVVRNQSLRFKGALEGLNQLQFARGGADISVSKRGLVTEKTYEDGVTYAKVVWPVYCALRKSYKGMLFVNLAHRGLDALSKYSWLDTDKHVLECSIKVGDYYWVSTINPSHGDLDSNPFDYAQAILPSSLQQAGGDEVIDTASLCGFLSEVFRFLNPEDRALYLEIMGQGKRFDKFLNYAASTRSHHNKEHGLLLHTAETVAYVLLEALATTPEERASDKPPFDLSLTLLAALLHDAAKVEEYHRLAPDVYVTNLNCELMGHEQTVLKWIAVACAASGAYCADRELQLEHSICAVKKQHYQSGVRKRKTPESFALHQADCASARAFDKNEISVLLTHQFVQGDSK